MSNNTPEFYLKKKSRMDVNKNKESFRPVSGFIHELNIYEKLGGKFR